MRPWALCSRAVQPPVCQTQLHCRSCISCGKQVSFPRLRVRPSFLEHPRKDAAECRASGIWRCDISDRSNLRRAGQVGARQHAAICEPAMSEEWQFAVGCRTSGKDVLGWRVQPPHKGSDRMCADLAGTAGLGPIGERFAPRHQKPKAHRCGLGQGPGPAPRCG